MFDKEIAKVVKTIQNIFNFRFVKVKTLCIFAGSFGKSTKLILVKERRF